MRVPTGSICGVISTAALRSKRMTEPSARLMSLAMRTTTAFITSPFFTRPRGMASFTETTMTSPMVAYLRLEPPSTLMHMTRRAPELSATSRFVCIWIMMRLSLFVRAIYLGTWRSLSFLFLIAADHFPALELGDRATLFDPHRVADGKLILLVMRMIFLRTANGFLHRRMGETPVDAHDDGLVLLVADDDALERTLRHLEPLTSSTSSRQSSSRQPCGSSRTAASLISAWRIPASRPSAWQPWASPPLSVSAQSPASIRRAFARQWSSGARRRGG